MSERFKFFQKLQSRYWINMRSLDPNVLYDELSNKIDLIEKRDFGVDEDTYIVTTQTKIIINGLSLKIYEFIKNSITFVEQKQYIAAISVLRLCIEHLAMLSFFNGKLVNYIEENNRQALQMLLFSFCMGERIYFVDTEIKDPVKTTFSTRAEHVSSALRYFDRKYYLGIQVIYDMFSNHSHVSPTSSVRMLYRQKIWYKSEKRMDWRRVRLSTKSNSNEKLASGGVEQVLRLLKVVETDVIAKQEKIAQKMEKIGQEIELNDKINPKADKVIHEILSMHDKVAEDFFKKIEKYAKPKQ